MSSSATLDAVLAKIPAAARPNTQAGAEAFGRFFIESVGKAFASADPHLLDGLAAQTCKTCAAFNASIDAMRAKGRHHASPSIQVLSSSANRFVDDDPNKVIAVSIRQIEVDIVDAKGRRVGVTQGNSGAFVLTLTWNVAHWEVALAQVEKDR